MAVHVHYHVQYDEHEIPYLHFFIFILILTLILWNRLGKRELLDRAIYFKLNVTHVGFQKTQMEDQTFFKQLSDFERYSLMLYLLIVLILSIVGDAIILIASTRYNALKLNKFILVIIHHISVCDLITDFSMLLPILAALWTEDWIFKGILSSASAFFASWSYLLSNIQVVILTFSKFFLVKFPRKTRIWSAKKAHMVCGFAYLAVLPATMPLIIDRSHSLVEHLLRYHIGFANDIDVMRNYSQNAEGIVLLTGWSSFILLNW